MTANFGSVKSRYTSPGRYNNVHDSSSHILKAHHGHMAHHGCVSMHVLARARSGMGHKLGGLTQTVAKHAHPRPA